MEENRKPVKAIFDLNQDENKLENKDKEEEKSSSWLPTIFGAISYGFTKFFIFQGEPMGFVPGILSFAAGSLVGTLMSK